MLFIVSACTGKDTDRIGAVKNGTIFSHIFSQPLFSYGNSEDIFGAALNYVLFDT